MTVTHKPRKWPQAPTCPGCRARLPAGRRSGKCQPCRQKMIAVYKRRQRAKGVKGPVGRPPVPDPGGLRAKRVEAYAARVASGLRLFEPTPGGVK